MDNKALAEQLVKSASTKGADAAEVYLESGRQPEPRSPQRRDRDGRGGRLPGRRHPGLRGGPDGLRQLATTWPTPRLRTPRTGPSASPASRPPTRTTSCRTTGRRPRSPGLYDPSHRLGPAGREDRAGQDGREAGHEATRGSPRAPARATARRRGEIVIANSNGLSKSYRSSSCGVRRLGRGREGRAEVVGRRKLRPPLLRRPQARRRHRGQGRPGRARDCSTRGLVKTQRAAVIFDPDVAGALLGGILAAVNGETRPAERQLPGRRSWTSRSPPSC